MKYIVAAASSRSAASAGKPAAADLGGAFQGNVFAACDWKSSAAFAFPAILMYKASMLFVFAALEHLDVAVASISLYLVPIFTVLLAALLPGELSHASASAC
jgi:drug/metabolite transporter (DMT)-like permease